MKKSVVVIISFFGIISCKKNDSDVPLNKIDSISKIEVKTPIVQEFKSKTEELCYNLKQSEAKVLGKMKLETSENVNKLYEDFRIETDTIVARLGREEGKLLDEEYNGFYSEVTNKIVIPEKYKEKFSLFEKTGIEIKGIGEGYNEINLKPNYFLNLFKNKVTPDYNVFLELEAKDNSVLYSADAGLGISFEDLSKRVLNWEFFLVKYPKSKLFKQSRETYRTYLMDYLFGMDNTPSFDYESKLLIPSNKSEYERFLKSSPNSVSSKIIKLFLQNENLFDENGNEKLYKLIEKEQVKYLKPSI